MSSNALGNNPDVRALLSELNAQASMKQLQQGRQHGTLTGISSALQGAGPEQLESLIASRAGLQNPMNALYGGGLASGDLSLRHSIASTHPSLLLDAERNANALLELMAYERAKNMAARRDAGTLRSVEASDMLELQRAAALERNRFATGGGVASIDRLAALSHGLGGPPSALADSHLRTQDLLSSLPASQAAALLGQIMGGAPRLPGADIPVHHAGFPDLLTSQGPGSNKILEEAKRLASTESSGQGLMKEDGKNESDVQNDTKGKKYGGKKAAKLATSRGRKGKKSYKRKKPQDMPRRPLSAYNLFFSAERERILKEIDAKEKGEKASEEDAAESGSEKPATPDNPDALLRPMVLDKPRVHKKMHGKVDFRTLAKMVGERWGQLSAEKRAHYQELASQDSQRHKIAMEQYYKKKHEERMALLTESYDSKESG